MVRSINLSGMTNADGSQDTGAQVNYLYDYLNTLYTQMGTATSPEELQYLNQEAQSVLSQILSIAAQSGDPEYIKAMQQWALDAIKYMREQTADRIRALGDEVSAANPASLERFNPIFTAFQNAFETASDAIGGGGHGGNDGNAGGLVDHFDTLGAGAKVVTDEFAALADVAAELRQTLASIRGGGPGQGNARVSECSYDYGAAVASRRRRIA
ncbi:MAG: hypothetical protein WC538_22690 [Thermoanaerobaculia bacterium]